TAAEAPSEPSVGGAQQTDSSASARNPAGDQTPTGGPNGPGGPEPPPPPASPPPPPAPAEEPEGGTMTILEHLEELRQRIIIAGIALICGMAISAFFLVQRVMEWLVALRPANAAIIN